MTLPEGLIHPDRTLVMGIVNVTPDSFSDGGRFADPGAAVDHAWRLVDEGADVIDIGAESTRPGHTPVSDEEEWARLEPVLRQLCQRGNIIVSVDTSKASTAAKALAMGVHLINDIWGGLASSQMLKTIADAGCVYVWMHNRPEPAAKDPFGTLLVETKNGIDQCLEAGIRPERLWIDPGIGFGKTREHNLVALKRLSEYCRLGYPVLLGTSRKGFIGRITGGNPEERLEGSLATAALAVAAGVKMVRVHDVAATVKTCRMVEAILNA